MHYKEIYKKKKRQKIISNIILYFLVIIFLSLLLKLILPNFEKIDYRDKVLANKDEILINLNNNYINLENTPIIQDTEVFLPVDFIKQYIDEYIFWDKAENKLTITNEYNVIRMKTEELRYFVNSKPLNLDIPVYNINGIAYIPKDLLGELYSFDFNYIEDTKIMDITKKGQDFKIGKIRSNNTRLRDSASRKGRIIDFLRSGETVYISEDKNEKYFITKTEKGYIGYLPKKDIINITSYSIEDKNIIDENNKKIWKVENGKINLVFDQVIKVYNSLEYKRKYHDGVDILVPTFFSFANEEGDIINIADKGYVKWAHNNGYQVWGLLTDNFDEKISHGVLYSTENREHVIKQLLAYVALYNLDGINIDFESVPKKDGEYFIQFLRELAPLLKEQGAVLSVDTFIPKPWTLHYNRKEIGKIADYIIVMGYDEHYSGSQKAGSVASISWSEEAIKGTLNEGVTKEKIILGIPFYTRVWTEKIEDGKVNLYSKSFGMNGAYNFVINEGGDFIWDEDSGQHYAEINKGDIVYKVWLEDEISLEKRLSLVLAYDIAGVGAWKRGLEKDEVWKILKYKLK